MIERPTDLQMCAFYNDDDVFVGVDVDDDDDDDDVDVDDCLFRGRHDLPEEKPVIGCNAPHDEYPLSDYDFHRNTHHGDDDDDSGDDDDGVDVCQSNIYRECVSSLPRRRHQTACGYTLARRQEHHQHHHHYRHQHHHQYKHQCNQVLT